jgi:hypothetical protein
VFRRHSDENATADAAVKDAAPTKTVDNELSQASRKGRPTPTRREAEAARKRRLGGMPADPKERKVAERSARNAAFDRQRKALRSGDERNYPARDRGPVASFIRDYVDGRLRLLEFLMPLIVLSYVLLFTERGSSTGSAVTLAMQIVIVLGVVLVVLLALRVRSAVRKEFGAEAVRGATMYTVSRAVMPRFLRQPKPRVTFTGKQK